MFFQTNQSQQRPNLPVEAEEDAVVEVVVVVGRKNVQLCLRMSVIIEDGRISLSL